MIKLRATQPNDASRRRVTPSTVLSVGLHVVLLIGLWYALELPNPLGGFRSPDPVDERLAFVTVQPPAAAGGGAARPSAPVQSPSATPPVATPLPVPTEIPTGIPAPTPAAPNLGPTTGPVVGGQGPTRGVQPAYVDPRVWVATPSLQPAPKTDEQRLDSTIVAELKAHNDSLAVNRHAPNKFERGDWTVGGPGGKWGIDPQFIRLGKFSIPTALLALLPVNAAPGAAARELQQNPALALHRAEIPYQAQRAVTHEEFRKAVKQLRERKDRERREQQDKADKKPIAGSGH